jgi:serine/threonine protein kinase
MARVLLRATNEKGEVDGEKLAEYKANVAYDLWSFGVVLFHLCFGRPLWLTDINDNVTPEDLRVLASGSGESLRRVLDKALNKGEKRTASIDLKAATALLRKLLEPDPSKRLGYFELTDRPMEAVLEEPFFQALGIDAATLKEINQKVDNIALKLVDMSEEHRTELLLTRKVSSLYNIPVSTCSPHTYTLYTQVLLKGIFEATEVLMPTTFIILDEELSAEEPELSAEEHGTSCVRVAQGGGAASNSPV